MFLNFQMKSEFYEKLYRHNSVTTHRHKGATPWCRYAIAPSKYYYTFTFQPFHC
jgi:hypothetical protein